MNRDVDITSNEQLQEVNESKLCVDVRIYYELLYVKIRVISVSQTSLIMMLGITKLA